VQFEGRLRERDAIYKQRVDVRLVQSRFEEIPGYSLGGADYLVRHHSALRHRQFGKRRKPPVGGPEVGQQPVSQPPRLIGLNPR
jgi:hypothetical protein